LRINHSQIEREVKEIIKLSNKQMELIDKNLNYEMFTSQYDIQI
jgi:hypothetical protein